MDFKVEEIYQEELKIITTFFFRGYNMKQIKYLLDGNTVVEVLSNKIHTDLMDFNRVMKNKNKDKRIVNNEKYIVKILTNRKEDDITSCIVNKLDLAIKTLEEDAKQTPRRKDIIKQLKIDKSECQKIMLEDEEILIHPKQKGLMHKILEASYPREIKN